MGIDLLVGQAYYLKFDPSLLAAERPYAPLGALYAAACAREAGYRVALFDAMLADSVLSWDATLDRERPQVAVIFEDSFNYLSKMCLLRMREAALAMIASARKRGVPVLVAGSDATDHPAMYLQQGARAVITGEGERTLVHVLDTLRRGSETLDSVDGVAFSRNGLVVRTSPRALVKDLDSLPMPAWDLVDVDRYRDIWLRRHGYFSMNISTTRGCPYHCNWCAKPIYGQRYTVRSPERVADEIAWLKQHYRPDHLWVTDDIFGLKPGWVEAFASAVRAREAVVPFKCLMRADGVDAQMARALRDAGCRTVWIGAESGSQRILDLMEKGTSVGQIEDASRLLKSVGIDVGFFLQFGYPGETLDDIEQTLAMVGRCEPDDIGVSVSYPLPGTPFHARVASELGEKRNWLDSADLAVMYRATYAPDFYRALHRFTHARFRAARGWSAFRRLATSPLRTTGAEVASIVTGAVHAGTLPLQARRVRRLARRQTAPTSGALMVPVLNPRAASVPTEPGS